MGTAGADPIADFKAGTAVRVATAIAEVGDGTRTSSSVAITKPAGTFDFTLDAVDLGVKLPIALHLHGKDVGGGWIEYTVDEVYKPEIDLGEGHWVSGVTGRLYLRASPLPGSLKHDVGNVRLQIARASSVTAHGDWGQLTIAIAKLDLFGGIKQPPLESFFDPSKTRICSGKEATKLALVVSLTDAAKATGASVELRGPSGAGVGLPGGIAVAAGKQSAIVTARIQPNFVGTVRLTASAGGIARPLDVVVYPSGDCR